MPKAKKQLEDIYQKKTQLEHVLLRPDTYIGSVERQGYATWVHDGDQMVHRDVSVVPGLYKIFDEILVNAADNKVRDPSMDELRVVVDPEKNLVQVWNNGEGIPIHMHEKEGVYIPELIFGHLLTSSNFDDEEKKMTGGRNGYGAKLANIFSTNFTIETSNGKQHYMQSFMHNMTQKQDPQIQAAARKDGWTCITFHPDLAKFHMTHLDDDIVCIMRKRAYDMAGLFGQSVKVMFNGQRLKIKNFEEYVDMYLGKKGEGTPRVYLKGNDRWEIVAACTDGEFKQMSFVNSISTIKGGTHVNYIADQLCKGLVEKLNKKTKSNLRPVHVKNHLHLFINCMIENPAFDSQTKENMTTRVSAFGSTCVLPDDFVDKVAKCGVLDQLINLAQMKSAQLLKKSDGSKTSRVNIPKLDDASSAGTRNSAACTLILTEGDSAKALAMAGISVVGRETFGVFPLRGKLLNVRDASTATISGNKEIQSLKQIIGLQHNKEYEDTKRLRYGHVMIMTDQDHDGSHIKGLIINFLHHCHPSLIRLPNFIQVFVTPIVKVSKGDQVFTFYTMPEYEAWKEEVGRGAGKWKVKYYKGLGDAADDAIDMAFSKKRVANRKEWMAGFEEGTYLDHSEENLSFTDFVNKELILFSLADIDRSIPSLVDGLKVTQRKIIYSCLKKGGGELKVIQLVGYVSQHAAYHHGETSLSSTIIGLAQNFVGSNNINLLEPAGQFGTRLQGGKDAASPRYLHTALGPLTRLLLNKADDDLLDYLKDDGLSIQPAYYVPIIPLVLVNGAEGIGTGWSTSIPNYNPIDIIDNLLNMIDGQPPQSMHPWYMGYKGTIEQGPTAGSYTATGMYVVKEREETIEINDLALKKWTDDYKEFLKEAITPSNASGLSLLHSFDDLSTDTLINIKAYVNEEQMARLVSKGIAEALKLTLKLNTSNMVLFDENGRIRKYSDVREIMAEFFRLRMEFYVKRKAHMVKVAEMLMRTLDNKARFIMAVINEEFIIRNRKKSEIEADLERMGFDKQLPQAKKAHQSGSNEGEEVIQNEEVSFNYLLRIPLEDLTLERVQDLLERQEQQKQRLTEIRAYEINEMYRQDLNELRAKYEEYREKTLQGMQSRVPMANARRGRARRGGRAAARGRGNGRGQTTSAANNPFAAGPSARGRGGRGRGRGRGQAASSSATSQGNGSTEAASNDVPTAPDALSTVREGTSATQTGRRPKRQHQAVVMEDSSDEDEASPPPQPVSKRPRRQAPKKPAVEEETAEADGAVDVEGEESEEAVELDSDSDFVASGSEGSEEE